MKRKAVDKYTLHCFSAHISGWLLLHFFGELQFSDLSERGYDNRYKDTHPLVCARFEDESSTRVQTPGTSGSTPAFIQCLHFIILFGFFGHRYLKCLFLSSLLVKSLSHALHIYFAFAWVSICADS